MNQIPEKESLTVEFKRDPPLSHNEIVDVVVGFANTDGGDFYLGVGDDGSVTGLHSSHTDVTEIKAMIANKTRPSVSVCAEMLEQNGHHYMKIEVQKSQAITASTNGKILHRILKHDNTPETVPFPPYEFTSRFTELGKLDYSEQIVPNATYDDLDPIERERLRKLIRTHNGETKLLELTDEELDKSLQFVKSEGDKLIPTVTGLLLIGKSDSLKNHLPTAKIAFQVMEGTDIRINEDITVPLLAAFEIIEEYMKAWNPEREIQSGLFRIPIPEFDNRAIREALVNAFAHRDYTQLERVCILINDDGLTISSPGGFIEGVTLTNLLTVPPRGRNPALADALKRLGLAERIGRGIDRIYEGSIRYGRPWPDYSKSDRMQVILFIQRAKPDTAFTRMILDEKNRLGRDLPVTSLLILSFLKDELRATTHQIAEKIHKSEPITKSALEQLSEAGLIETQGGGRGRTYMLSSKVYQKQTENASQKNVKIEGWIKLLIKEVRQNLKDFETFLFAWHVKPEEAIHTINTTIANLQLVQKILENPEKTVEWNILSIRFPPQAQNVPADIWTAYLITDYQVHIMQDGEDKKRAESILNNAMTNIQHAQEFYGVKSQSKSAVECLKDAVAQINEVRQIVGRMKLATSVFCEDLPKITATEPIERKEQSKARENAIKRRIEQYPAGCVEDLITELEKAELEIFASMSMLMKYPEL